MCDGAFGVRLVLCLIALFGAGSVCLLPTLLSDESGSRLKYLVVVMCLVCALSILSIPIVSTYCSG